MSDLAKQKLTLSQFKSWLEGVEEMQGEEWAPNVEQWKKIRAKISQLEENSDTSAMIRKTVSEAVALQLDSRGYRREANPAIPGSIASIPQSQLDVAVSSTPVGGVPKLTTVMPGQPSEVIKTPNIDTSRAGYVTPFA